MKTLLFIITLLISGSISAQFTANNIAFWYDDAGNRNRRELCACVGSKTGNPNPIDTVTHALEANLLPNPTKGKLAVSVTETTFVNSEQSSATAIEEIHFHIIVYDIYGRELLNEQYNNTQFNIDITDKPPGTYFVKVFTANKVKQWKIVKN